MNMEKRQADAILAIALIALLAIIVLFFKPPQVMAQSAPTISVVVLADGQPLQGAPVHFTQRGKPLINLTTGADGTVSFQFTGSGASYLEYTVYPPQSLDISYEAAANASYIPDGQPYFYNLTLLMGAARSYTFYAYFHAVPKAFGGDGAIYLTEVAFFAVIVLAVGVMGARRLYLRRGGYKPRHRI